MTELVSVDIGGTNARFALAEVKDRRVARLEQPCTLAVADYPGLEAAWEEFARRAGRPLPRAAAIAIAGSPSGETIRLTNGPWVIRPAQLESELGVERAVLVNDFGAVGHAVAQLGREHFRHLCGPMQPLPDDGVISIVGPGTGLGVAQLLRRGERSEVIETEGGHIGFAPLDGVEDRLLTLLRRRFGRVSVERVASGQALRAICELLAEIEGRPIAANGDEKMLWAAALDRSDRLAAAALDRLCLILGSVAGDIALAQGASAVVIAGGLGLRLADQLAGSGFRERFIAKGRFTGRMERMPVKIITHPQPGLFGAAAAFSARMGQ